MIVFLTIVWLILAGTIGEIEAVHFYAMRNETIKIEEHPKFTLERFLMWIPFLLSMHTDGLWITWLNGLCLPFLFVLMHDGIYYHYRNLLDKSYPKGFFDFSTTSTALADRMRLTLPWLRITYFIIGIIGLYLINVTFK